MKSKMKFRVIGKINGVQVIKEFEQEYSADTCAKTLNEVFAPFVVEGIEPETIVPAPATSSDGMPF